MDGDRWHCRVTEARGSRSTALPAGVALALVLVLQGCGCGSECGDGVLEGRETCEDGNTTDGDGCSDRCRVEPGSSFCGNGILEGAEQCDNGDANDDMAPDACRTNCTPAFCGDNILDTGEECEPPLSATCGSTCLSQICGNGEVEGDEDCDDGSANSDVVPDACRTDCEDPVCGDLVLDTLNGEECEPPLASGCTITCQISLKSNHGTCAMPQAVTPGTLAIAAVTALEPSTTEGSCRFVSTPPMPLYAEAVFQLDLVSPADLVISTDNAGTDMDTYLYVRGGDCAAGPELGCNDDIDLGGSIKNLFSEVTLTGMPAGTYFIFVDGSYDDPMNLRSFGPIALSVDAVFILAEGMPCDPAGVTDRCELGLTCVSDGTPTCDNLATPICAAAPAAALGPTSGSTAAGTSELSSACDLVGTTLATEVVQLLDLPAGTGIVDVLADASAGVGSPAYAPVLSLRTTCDDLAAEAGCGLADAPGGASHAEAWGIDATGAAASVAVIVDGTAAGGATDFGDYDLVLATRPVRGSGDGCDPAGSDRCGDGLTCGPGATCIAAGDCATPIALEPFLRGHGATTPGVPGTAEASCAFEPGHDEVVFVIGTPVLQDIILTTALPPTGFDTVLHVRDGSAGACSDPAAEVACNDDVDAAARDFRSEVVVWDAAPGVSYYVFVDGSFDDAAGYFTGLAGEGAFEVAARYRPIVGAGGGCDPTGTASRCDWGLSCTGALDTCVDAPDGLECAAAADVTAAVDGTPAALTTVGADDSFRGSCSTNPGGVETVVSFTLAAPAALLTISTDNPGTTHTDTVLSVRRPICAALVDEIACNDDIDLAGLNFLSSVTIAGAPAGTYFVIVDGWDAFVSGAVELSIETM